VSQPGQWYYGHIYIYVPAESYKGARANVNLNSKLKHLLVATYRTFNPGILASTIRSPTIYSPHRRYPLHFPPSNVPNREAFIHSAIRPGHREWIPDTALRWRGPIPETVPRMAEKRTKDGYTHAGSTGRHRVPVLDDERL